MSPESSQQVLLRWLTQLSRGTSPASLAAARTLAAEDPCEYNRTHTADRELLQALVRFMATQDCVIGELYRHLLASDHPCRRCPLTLLRPGAQPPGFHCLSPEALPPAQAVND